ncbi:hypothetical protein M4D52_13895 [Paenibacillus lactis]|uniref:hypothetical protein n=1 Tax=Paenibacillus lactis TaxID=228574 RepID=UPI00203FEB36|nr:hypothetical protein [Paenibacillus lactis]MCM3494529.1 hypothetical protein [Paenibacillus lactis]
MGPKEVEKIDVFNGRTVENIELERFSDTVEEVVIRFTDGSKARIGADVKSYYGHQRFVYER